MTWIEQVTARPLYVISDMCALDFTYFPRYRGMGASLTDLDLASKSQNR
jgi:hypothetical protein